MKNTRRLRLIAGLLLLILVLVQLSACSGREEPEANPEEGFYAVYYQGSSYASIMQVVQVEASETEAIAGELFEILREPGRQVDGISVLPPKMELLQVRQEGQVLYLYFNNEYLDMDATQSVICLASLTKTMTQIPGIEYISIYVGNQPLMDASGSLVGNLSSADFVNVIGKDINTIQHTTLTLYFANMEGDKLVGEELEVTYSNTFSVEEYIVERLIEGPEDTTLMQPVIPAGTQLLGVSVRDGICYVNFSEDMLSGSLPVSPEISIYAIVDSLTTLPTITQVQITIGGSYDREYNGISLAEPFFQNLDYILNKDEK